MKRSLVRSLWVTIAMSIGISLCVAFHAAGDATAAELKVGDAAPDFSLRGTDGNQYQLRELVGKQAVVIAWFPKAFTPG